MKKNCNNDYVLLVFLTLIVALLAYYRAFVQIEIGPIWDATDFLSNAMYLAGNGFGYVDLTRPPFLPFLTSLFFRLGLVGESTIFYLDASFLALGAIGLYLFFRMKFEPIISFLGSLIFATFPIVITFTGVGLSDVPSVVLSIWALYTTVLAVKKDSNFFYLSFPLAMIAFLTRYSVGLIIFLILFYIFINRHNVSLEKIFGGILLSLVPGIIVILFFYTHFHDPLYPFYSFYSTTQKAWSNTFVYYQPDPLYFLKNILKYIGSVGMTILLIVVMSIFIYTITHFEDLKLRFKELYKYKIDNNTKIMILSLIILFIVFILSFTRIHFIFSELLFFSILFLTYYLVRGNKIHDLDYHFLFCSWFMAFFIFHSIYVIKDDRYFITMAPFFSYFLILTFSWISGVWKLKNGYHNLLYRTLIAFFIVMMLLSAVYYIQGIPDNEPSIMHTSRNIQSASNWLKHNDMQYNDKIIYSDRWPQFSWYLRTNVRKMPSFNTQESYDNQLNINNADYYLSVKDGLNLKNYQPIKHIGVITIYKRR